MNSPIYSIKQKTLATIMAIAIAVSGFSLSAESSGDNTIIIIPKAEDPNRPRPHAPARHITAYYADGVLTIPSWPYTDEDAHIDITDADGTTITAVDCAGAEMAAGVAIGSFGCSFTIIITISSGTVLTGTF